MAIQKDIEWGVLRDTKWGWRDKNGFRKDGQQMMQLAYIYSSWINVQ